MPTKRSRSRSSSSRSNKDSPIIGHSNECLGHRQPEDIHFRLTPPSPYYPSLSALDQVKHDLFDAKNDYDIPHYEQPVGKIIVVRSRSHSPFIKSPVEDGAQEFDYNKALRFDLENMPKRPTKKRRPRRKSKAGTRSRSNSKK